MCSMEYTYIQWGIHTYNGSHMGGKEGPGNMHGLLYWCCACMPVVLSQLHCRFDRHTEQTSILASEPMGSAVNNALYIVAPQ